MQLVRVAWALTGAAICCFLILLIHSRLLKEGNYSELHRFSSLFYVVLMRHNLSFSFDEVFRYNNPNAWFRRNRKYRLYLVVAFKSKSILNHAKAD